MKENVKAYRILISIIFLLMIGLNQGWAATREYTVRYTGVPAGYTGGYTVIKNTYTSYYIFTATIISSDNAEVLVINQDFGTPDNLPSDILSYIRPKSIEGYYATITVNNRNNTITIAYRAITSDNSTDVFYTWTCSPGGVDGGLEVKTSSITYEYNSSSYTSMIYGPVALDSEEDAIAVFDVPTKNIGGNRTRLYSYNNGNVPAPINNSNITTYLQPKAVEGYTATISSVGTSDYWNTFTVTVTYTPIYHTRYYTVHYNEGAPSGKGYSLKTNSLANGTTLTRNGNSITAATGNNSNYAPTLITWENVDDVIEPTAVSGFATKTIVSGGKGTQTEPYIITINYYNNWVIDGLEYSTFYVESTDHQYALPSGKVAVSLYLGGPVSGDISGDETLWETVEITDIVSYAGGINLNGDQLTTTTGETSNATDDDGDVAGTTASYKCLGQLAKDIPANEYVDENGNTRTSLTFSSDYFYERTHQVVVSKLSNVVIPSTVPGAYGEGEYEVTAIQKFGFNYAASDQNDLIYCPMGDDSNQISIPDNINSRRNDYLQSVTFEQPCNVSSIGDYAFMSCLHLKTFTVPYTVEYLGVGAFECSQELETVLFQTNPDTSSDDFGKTRLSTINNWTFWYCTGLKSVSLADGITRIEGQPSGSSFQYNAQLTYIRLPNTLQYIGPHFLCSATSIKTVTIPASVTYIDGACFHGCESLEKVYLLGEAAYLRADDGGTSRTFDYNETLCGGHVSQCEFFVPEQYLDEYQRDDVWKLVDEQGKSDGSTYVNAEGQTVVCENGNFLKKMPTEERTFSADTWQTVIFPQRTSNNSQGAGIGVKNYKTVFGSNTMVAELSEVHQDANDQRLYHLTFTEISGDNIPSGKPLMIKPSQQTTFTMFDASDQADASFLLDMTDEHSIYKVAPEDGTIIYMKGCYMPETKLAMWDFYFTRVNGEYVFRKVPDTSFHRVSTATRCWWRFEAGGVPVNVNGAKAFVSAFDDETTDINYVEQLRFVIDGVYDLNGRKISDVEFESQSHHKGIYVVNGKKVIVK